jgi:hypothetical protein
MSKFIPVRKVFQTFPHLTAMGNAFAKVGIKVKDRDYVRSPGTSTTSWKEVA